MAKPMMNVGLGILALGIVAQLTLVVWYWIDAQRTNRLYTSTRFFGWLADELGPPWLRWLLLVCWVGGILGGIVVMAMAARGPASP